MFSALHTGWGLPEDTILLSVALASKQSHFGLPSDCSSRQCQGDPVPPTWAKQGSSHLMDTENSWAQISPTFFYGSTEFEKSYLLIYTLNEHPVVAPLDLLTVTFMINNISCAFPQFLLQSGGAVCYGKERSQGCRLPMGGQLKADHLQPGSVPSLHP